MNEASKITIKHYFFGDETKKLYGTSYLPSCKVKANVIICNPLGQEYIKGHCVIKKLAQELVAKNLNVLCFDYYGCGDSYGRFEEISMNEMICCVDQAILEIKKINPAGPLILVGVRFGALLCNRYCRLKDMSVDALVLWHPVIDGIEYIRELKLLHKTWKLTNFSRKTNFENGHSKEILGYKYNLKLLEEISEDENHFGSAINSKSIYVVGKESDLLRMKKKYKVAKTDDWHFDIAMTKTWLIIEQLFYRNEFPMEDIGKIVRWINSV